MVQEDLCEFHPLIVGVNIMEHPVADPVKRMGESGIVLVERQTRVGQKRIVRKQLSKAIVVQ
jgi:hypothetical protein